MKVEDSSPPVQPKSPGGVFFEGDSVDKVDQALDCFKQFFNCSQAIVSTYGPGFGLHRECALKTSALFGGGVAGLGETCGAVVGALMVIGLAFGKANVEDKEAVKQTNRAADFFIERFKKRNFTVRCRELLGCEVGTAEGMKFLKENNLREQLCSHFVKDAAEILEDLLFSETRADSE
jgi:C_GCAxxG_C_C family probable redox protein